MANVKITDLAAYTNPDSTDVLPIVDVGADVTKKISIADLLENAGSGTAAAPGIAFDGDSNTGIYRPGADQLAISTNGAQALYIDSDGDILVADGNRMEIDEIRARDGAGLKLFDDGGAGIFIEDGGNVGLGTSSPERTLSIRANNPMLQIEGSGGNGRQWSLASVDDTSGASLGLSGNFAIYDDSSGGGTRLSIDSSGNVGIGTTSPSVNLHVQNNGSSGGNIQIGSETIDFGTSQLNLWGQNNYIGFRHKNVGGGGNIAYVFGGPGALGTDNSGFLAFGTRTSGNVLSESARIDPDGRLLVGTSSAAASPLATAVLPHVQFHEDSSGAASQTMFASWTSGTDVGYSLNICRADSGTVGTYSPAIGSTDVLGNIRFSGSDGAKFIEGAKISAVADGTWGTDDGPAALVFSTTADGFSSPTPRVQINSSGALQLLAGCPGIDFSGIQTNAAGMTSETLDSYEEGTFTPYLVSDTGGEWPGKTTDSGFYTKIGRIVHVHGEITWSSQSAGAAGTVRIFGLPFGSTSTSDAAPYIQYNATELFDAIRLQNTANSSHFRASGSAQSPTGFSASGSIPFNFTYRVS